jgi:hypothetical protein
MSGFELVLAFLAGVVMGGALDRFVLPLLVDAATRGHRPQERRGSSTSADGISAERAVAWLRELSKTWRAAEVPAERADLLHAVCDRITVAGRRIVSVRLTPSAYAHGFALALPKKVAVARPTGAGRADAMNIRIPIEGVGAPVDRTA